MTTKANTQQQGEGLPAVILLGHGSRVEFRNLRVKELTQNQNPQ